MAKDRPAMDRDQMAADHARGAWSDVREPKTAAYKPKDKAGETPWSAAVRRVRESYAATAGKAAEAVKGAASSAADVTYKAVTGQDAGAIRKRASDAAGLRDALKRDESTGYGA